MKKLTVEDLLYFQEEVIKWNENFDNLVSDKSLINTYINLSKEEFNGDGEYLDSYNKGDMEGRLDGLVDSIFTGFMWMALGDDGFTGEELWLNQLIDREGTSNFVTTNINTTIDDLVEALEIEYLNGYKVNLLDLILREQLNFDIRGGFDLVLKSNYSKSIPVAHSDKVEKELIAIENKGRYADLFSEVNGECIILRAHKDLEEGTYFPKGKIVKAPNFFLSVEDLGGLSQFVY